MINLQIVLLLKLKKYSGIYINCTTQNDVIDSLLFDVFKKHETS